MTDSQNSYKRVAVIPGDGIGKEVIPEAVKVMNATAGSRRDYFNPGAEAGVIVHPFGKEP